jgi:hypothetical protein
MEGINVTKLITLGELLPTSCIPSCTPSHISFHSKLKKDEPMRIPAGHSTEMKCQPPQRLSETRDDPFGINDLASETSHPDDKNICLEGIPPNKFEGDRVKTLPFLIQFKWFMLINCHSTIVQNPYMKSAFFLSLIDGPKVEGWTQHTYDWLDQVEANPFQLPFKMSTWQALEADFKQSFIDYTEHKHV